jgi:hypothetical protein
MERKGIDFAAVPATAIKVITSPAVFFREMPKTGGFIEPLVFMIVMGVVAGLVQAVLAIAGLNVGAGAGMALASIIIFPVIIAIFGFIGAAIAFVIWKLMGSQETYETAYRCVAYITALWPITTIFGAIPYIGPVLAIALTVYFYAIAGIESHKIAPQTAWIVSGIIGIILIAMAVGAGIASRALRGEALQYQQQMEEMQKKMEKK